MEPVEPTPSCSPPRFDSNVGTAGPLEPRSQQSQANEQERDTDLRQRDRRQHTECEQREARNDSKDAHAASTSDEMRRCEPVRYIPHMQISNYISGPVPTTPEETKDPGR